MLRLMELGKMGVREFMLRRVTNTQIDDKPFPQKRKFPFVPNGDAVGVTRAHDVR
jgi:hypothetical protein